MGKESSWVADEATDPDTVELQDTRVDPGFVPPPETPEEARAQIAQTRAEMSETIEALKEKLSPDALKAQAKEAVKEAASNAVHSTVEKAKEAVGGAMEATMGAVGGAISAAKEAFGGAASATHDTVSNIGHSAAEAGGNVQQKVKDMAQNVSENAVPMAKGVGYMVVDTIKQNPLPVALIGGGLLYLYLNSLKNDIPQSSRYDTMTRGVTNYSEPSAIDKAKEKVSDIAGNVSHKVSDIAGDVSHKVSATADTVKDKVTDAASTVKTSVTDVTHKVTDQAQQSAVWVKDSTTRLMDESPLIVGVAVVALGALIGLLVPATEAENRMMGETRDKLVDTASQKASELTHKVSSVATKTLDSLKDSASDAITTVKSATNDAIDNAKSIAQNEVRSQNLSTAGQI